VEGRPHHVIQRGNRRQRVFFNDQDRNYYLKLLKENCDKYSVEIWAYCLMDNHVHLVLVPSDRNVFFRAVADTHQAYTQRINRRYSWRGYLWQGRFISFVMDDLYLMRALRYVERNPVRARLVKRAEEYRWSSARAHVGTGAVGCLSECPAIGSAQAWADLLAVEDEDIALQWFRCHVKSGKIMGDKDFLKTLSGEIQTNLLPRKRGPLPKK